MFPIKSKILSLPTAFLGKRPFPLKGRLRHGFFIGASIIQYGRPTPGILQPHIAGVVTITQLRALFAEISAAPSNVCIRTRVIGEMWHPNFMHVFILTKNGVVILNDEVLRKAITILRIEDIIQFEIDRKFQNYEPHFHYDVRISSQT